MKTYAKILSLFALAALAAVSLAQAADPTPAAAPAPADGPRPMVRRMMKHRLEMLTEKLSLTEDQRTKIKDIWKQAGAQGKAIHGEATQAGTAIREKAEALRKATHDQVRALLTAEQQAIFDKLPADGPGHEGAGRHKAKAKDNS